MEPILGEIRMFAGNFAPRGWEFCNGQILNINQNTALFSLLGTTYGGDGQRTFALPNMQSRMPMHWGQGENLPHLTLGETSGKEEQSKGEGKAGHPALCVSFIIATEGIYPSRN